MTLWHEYWISFIFDMTWYDCATWVLYIRYLWPDMTWLCEFSTECQKFLTWHDCVKWVLNVRNLWSDMTVWQVYWLSDVCDMTWLCVMCTEYQIFLIWHVMCLWYDYWISGICVMTCLCEMSTEYQTFVTWHNCVTCVMNISHLWHDKTLCISNEYQTFVTRHDMSVWHDYWISVICDVI